MNKNNIFEKIEDFCNNFQDKFSQQELIDVKLFIKNLLGKDGKLQKNITSIKAGKKCFSYQLDTELCLGSKEQTLDPQYSHVIPKNNIIKFKEKFGDIYTISNLMFNVITDKVIEANTNEHVFVGFCAACEKDFTENSDINIDSETNFTKQHMFKSLYRLLGKEIRGYTEAINFLKETKNSNSNDSKTFNLILERRNNSNLDLEIKKQIYYKIYLQSLALDVSIHLMKKNHIGPEGTLNAYELIKAEVSSNKLQIIGQSIIVYPVLFKDIELWGCIYINFIYDKIEDKTKCYMLIHSDIYRLFSTTNINFFKNNIKTATLISLISFINPNALLFSKYFKDRSKPHIEKILNTININNNLPQQLTQLINCIDKDNDPLI